MVEFSYTREREREGEKERERERYNCPQLACNYQDAGIIIDFIIGGMPAGIRNCVRDLSV